MATVITNLLSAIPVFGKDLVELIWKIELKFNLIIYIISIFFVIKLVKSWLYNGPSRIIENLGLKTNRLAKAILNNCNIILKNFSMLKFKIPKFSYHRSYLSSSSINNNTRKLEIN